VDWFKLKRQKMPEHMTYRRILADIVNVEELERGNSAYLSGLSKFGRQVLVAIEGKGSEIPTAPLILKSIDLRENVVMVDTLHTQRAVSIQIVEA
jgi:hypothetical protein